MIEAETPVEFSTQTNIELLEQLTETLEIVRAGTENKRMWDLYEETEKKILEAICILVSFRFEVREKEGE